MERHDATEFAFVSWIKHRAGAGVCSSLMQKSEVGIVGLLVVAKQLVDLSATSRKTRGDTVHVRCTAPGPGC